MKHWNFASRFLSWIAPLLLLAGCGGSSGGGQLKLSLTDAATDQYNAVYVTIDSVEVHQSGGNPDSGWQTVATPKKTYNLLDLMNGVREDLGLASLSPGHYTQMRLHLGSTPDHGINILSRSHPFPHYVIDPSNTVHELTVPSGYQSGVKIVQGFDVSATETTELILDFDASASVVIAGNSGKYQLKPTIKILETVDFAILSGNVTNGTDSSILANTLVTAQIFNAAATDKKDQVIVQTSTATDGTGAYKLFVKPGAYNIVAYKEGFLPSIQQLILTAGGTPIQDFVLTPAATGTIAGQVAIAGADNETFVTNSFRQNVTVGSAGTTIELVSQNVANGGNYSVNLPTGGIEVVSSTFGQTTQSATVSVAGGATSTLDISF